MNIQAITPFPLSYLLPPLFSPFSSSKIRPIPDNQEVFQHPTTYSSLIIDITERAAPESTNNDRDALHLHISDLYDADQGEEVEILELEEEVVDSAEGGDGARTTMMRRFLVPPPTENPSNSNNYDHINHDNENHQPYTAPVVLRTTFIVTHPANTTRNIPQRKSHITLLLIRLPAPYSADILVYATVPDMPLPSDVLVDRGFEGVSEEEVWKREVEEVRGIWERFVRELRVRDWGLFLGCVRFGIGMGWMEGTG